MARKRRDVPWLEQRENGVWYALKYDAAKRRTIRESLETKDCAEAQLRFARLLTEGFRGTRLVGAAGLTVHQALDQYYEEHVKPNVVARERQEYAIAPLKAYFGADWLLSDVDIAASKAYTAARLSGAIGKRKCTSTGTVRRELVVLIAAANHAARHRRIGPNMKPPTPMPNVELPAETRKNRTPWLAKETLSRLFAAADGKLLRFCRIAYFTAARRHSVEQMTKGQVDLAHGLIHLDPAGAAVTNKRRPTVPLYAEIRSDIEKLIAESPNDYLFGGIPDFYRPFVELCADIGVEAHPHMLRHSRATHMLMDGEDVYKVSRLLGDSVQTVLKTYAHATVEYLQTNSTIPSVA